MRRDQATAEWAQGHRASWARASTVASAIFLAIATFAFAAAVHRVIQKGRAFSVPEIAIARGDRVEFSNEDEFIHQIYVDSSEMSFDSAEQPPGQVVGITFAAAAPFRCVVTSIRKCCLRSASNRAAPRVSIG